MTVRISTDPADVDLDVVAAYLGEESYWARGRSREVVERSIEGSLVVVTALDPDDRMLGFGRVVGDGATFAWLADVFVLAEARGRGIGAAIVDVALGAPGVAGVKRVLLATADAHELYARFGFRSLADPGRWMAVERLP